MLFVFKQKTAYEMRISDWSSDVFSSDLSWTASMKSQRGAAPGVRAASRTPFLPFVLSLSKYRPSSCDVKKKERPFDKLRANGLDLGLDALCFSRLRKGKSVALDFPPPSRHIANPSFPSKASLSMQRLSTFALAAAFAVAACSGGRQPSQAQ